uniref:hypothetical protein n=1 Tax=Pseudomonas sp. MD330_11 TaxID=3241255 RepID=UPI0036D3B5B6
MLQQKLSCLPLNTNEMALKIQSSTPIHVVSDLDSRGANPHTTGGGVKPQKLNILPLLTKQI